MELHSVQDQTIHGQIERLKAAQGKRVIEKPFSDPIREFNRAGQAEGMVRNWLTYPIEERKRLVRDNFAFVGIRPGEEARGIPPETEAEFERRQQERWRGLNVIIQEESRAKPGNRCPEVAIAALKHLFPDHNWKTPPTAGAAVLAPAK